MLIKENPTTFRESRSYEEGVDHLYVRPSMQKKWSINTRVILDVIDVHKIRELFSKDIKLTLMCIFILCS